MTTPEAEATMAEIEALIARFNSAPQRVADIDSGELADEYRISVSASERATLIAALSRPAPTPAAAVEVVGWMAAPRDSKEPFARVFAHTEFRARELGDEAYGPAPFDVLPLMLASPAPAAEVTGERRKIIYEAVWQVCGEWRPGMSDEVKDAIGKRVVERIAKISDEHQALAAPSPDAGRVPEDRPKLATEQMVKVAMRVYGATPLDDPNWMAKVLNAALASPAHDEVMG